MQKTEISTGDKVFAFFYSLSFAFFAAWNAAIPKLWINYWFGLSGSALGRRLSAHHGRSGGFDSNWDGFLPQKLKAPCVCCGLCLQGTIMCVLWHVGVIVIVHSCMHEENQPWAGFTSCSFFSARCFFTSVKFSCPWKQERGLRVLLRCSWEQEVKALCWREGHWALLNSSPTAGDWIGFEWGSWLLSWTSSKTEKPTAMAILEFRKTIHLWLNRHLWSSSDLRDVHHPSSGKRKG